LPGARRGPKSVLVGPVALPDMRTCPPGAVSHGCYQDISTDVRWLKRITSRTLLQEFAHHWEQVRGRCLCSRGSSAVTSSSITDEMIARYVGSRPGDRSKAAAGFESTGR
jgi:hypothetical protein